MQHFAGVHLTGRPGTVVAAGAEADEKSNKLTEQTDTTIRRRADFFKGIYSSFLGNTKITFKSYSHK
ncbi:MAG: hypothetical protein ABIS01_11405 [Ferruginibacter sp.]